MREKRIITTWIVSAAMKTLESKAQLVAKAFKDCSISILPDGSKDFKINIKDISNDQIDLSGWEDAKEVIIKDEELIPSSQDFDELIVAGDDDDPELRLSLMKTKELQHLLRSAKLPISGNKKTLLERLCDYLREKDDDDPAEDTIVVAIDDSGDEDDPAYDI